MTTPSSPVYCPLILQMVNTSSDPPNSTAKISSLSLLMLCFHGLVSLLGILENLLILGVVGFHVRRTVTSLWILNLAASDLLATTSLPFFTLYMAQGHTWTLGTTFCRLHSSIFFLNMFASGFLLAAISLDRCLMVLRPVWAQNQRNIRLVGKVCGLIWSLSLICTIPFYLFRDAIHQHNGKIQCYYNYARFLSPGDLTLASVCEVRQGTMALMKLFLSFLIPLLIIIASYAAVTTNVACRGNRCTYRLVRLVVAVVVCFVVCWAPYHLFSVMEVLIPDESSLKGVVARALPVAASISFINSVLNPVLYVFSCPDLRRKIGQSLSAVMESAMAEDFGTLNRRRSLARTCSSNVPLRKTLALTGSNVEKVQE
ncbi:prostaglandin D2 receptor 2-like [Lampris incognitus]|uniref:prostaglandin D2 receptor 2-like n=1 Tax=Lampris incognitus TaxID=2546036 RepID=UPI0024B504A9|nr:prostaglandin D2 receptor 2-like [Lampris incognitus]